MQLKLLSVSVILYLCLSLSAKAQDPKIKYLSVSVMTESVAFPFTLLSPLHPGIELGITLQEWNRARSSSKLNTYAGYFYHQELDQSYYLRGEYEYAFSIKDAVSVGLPVGLGYMHSFHTGPVYEQREDGSFEATTQTGRPHAILNVGLGVSYLQLGSLQPFARYEIMAQSPFEVTVPVVSRSFLKVGVSKKF
ncbi:MAG: hypothetical protein ACFB15_27920 [Cyclobacteriaceae bacterium]